MSKEEAIKILKDKLLPKAREADRLLNEVRRLINKELMVPGKIVSSDFSKFCFDLCKYFKK